MIPMPRYDILFNRPPKLIKRGTSPRERQENQIQEQNQQNASPLKQGWQPITCKRLELFGRRLYSTSKIGKEQSDRVKGYGIIKIEQTAQMEGKIHVFTEDFPDFIRVYLEKTRVNYGIFHIMQKNMSGKWIEITEDNTEQDVSFA